MKPRSEPDSTGDDLPPLIEVDLSEEQAQQLACDLAHCGELQQVLIRQSGRDGYVLDIANAATEREEQLKQLLAEMLAGECVAAKITYRFEQSLWIDTLMAKGNPFRLVRLRVPEQDGR